MTSLARGTRLGRYVVEKELNRGGTAVVYQGFDTATSLNVALKCMQLRAGREAVQRRAVEREVAFASKLRHPLLVQLLDCLTHGDLLVLVWELVSGLDLLDYLNAQGGVLGEPAAAGLFAQLVHAVTFIHAEGHCHRDLKPENVMVDGRTGRIKVIDFGLSRRNESAVTLGVGTPDYLAPELLGTGGGCDLRVLQERHTGRYDATKVDAWSVGVLLYLLVTGVYPFEDPLQPANVLRTLANISNNAYRPLPVHLSPELHALIGALLKTDAAERLSLPLILAHPWMAKHGHSAASPFAPVPLAPPAASTPAGGAAAPAVLDAAAEAAAAADLLSFLQQPGGQGTQAAAAAMEVDDASPRFSFHTAPAPTAGFERKPTPSTPRVAVSATSCHAPSVIALHRSSTDSEAAAPEAPAPRPAHKRGLFCWFGPSCRE